MDRLRIAYLNIRGQTSLTISKQNQIQDFISRNCIDILHCQEIDIENNTFNECNLISSSYNIISNNALNKYGTASFIKADFMVENVKKDTDGRIIIFDIGNITFSNLYFPSGNDQNMRSLREKYAAEVLPNMLINSKDFMCVGGDLNSIIDKKDATKNPLSKMSPSFKRLVSVFSLQDSFRLLHPNEMVYSRYYSNDHHGEGATRIDRMYHSGDIEVLRADYVPVALSDHLGLIIDIRVPANFSSLMSPSSRPLFKANPEVVRSKSFQQELKESMDFWREIKNQGVNIL